MKTSPLSSDLLLKVGIGAAALLVGYLALRKVSSTATAAAGAVLEGINPASTNNVIYRGTNWIGNSVVTNPEGPGKNADGSWTLGGFLYDITHPGVTAQVREVTKPVNIAGPQITVTPADPVSGGDMNYNYF